MPAARTALGCRGRHSHFTSLKMQTLPSRFSKVSTNWEVSDGDRGFVEDIYIRPGEALFADQFGIASSRVEEMMSGLEMS